MKTNAAGFRREVRAPRYRVPAGACDCHMHIVGPYEHYPLRETRTFVPPQSLLEDYLAIAKTIGTDRMVVVQPSFFAKDNACTLDSVGRSGDRARAVVVIEPDISDRELRAMHERGARGVRIQVVAEGGLSLDALESVAQRIAPLAWHVQLFVDAEDLPDLAPRLRRLPVPVVFDHMAHVRQKSPIDGPGFAELLQLVREGKGWVKLSNAFFRPSPARARLLVEANAKQIIWGSDWPHVAYREEVPDDGALLDLFAEWVPDEATRRLVLVENPDQLYFRP